MRNRTSESFRIFIQEQHLSKEMAHQKAFTAVVDETKSTVVNNNFILKFTSLLAIYTEKIRRCGFPNDNYRSDKLSSKLKRHKISN